MNCSCVVVKDWGEESQEQVDPSRLLLDRAIKVLRRGGVLEAGGDSYRGRGYFQVASTTLQDVL